MGTEVAISFNSLRAQLENEKSNLFKIDENIRKIVQTSGRFSNDRFHSSTEYSRGGARHSYPDVANFGHTDDGFGKRKYETKTVFSRLSQRAGDSEGEAEEEALGGLKRPRVSLPSAVSRELPSRAAVLRAQSGDEAARTRNRRIFGSLLGTLQKFKQEEITLQTKEDKRAQVERKIEEQARLERERVQRERRGLFAEREARKAQVKALEAQVARAAHFERCEAARRPLGRFILTKAKPHLYWLPARMTDKARQQLQSSAKFHEKCMARKRQELQEELQRIEQRVLRRPGAGGGGGGGTGGGTAGEAEAPRGREREEERGDDTGRKRDKFAADVDQREDSDHDDHHQPTNGDHRDAAQREEAAAADSAAAAAPAPEELELEQLEPPPPGTTPVVILAPPGPLDDPPPPPPNGAA